MIKWKTGEPVQAVMSHTFDQLTLTLNRFNKNTGQLEFVDKHGFKYYTYRKHVEFIMIGFTVPTRRISDCMILNKEDYFE